MPVLMRGGGGGKKIKDATAVPSDVALGKVFYDNNGRQIGTAVIPTIITKTYPVNFVGTNTERQTYKTCEIVGQNIGFVDNFNCVISGSAIATMIPVNTGLAVSIRDEFSANLPINKGIIIGFSHNDIIIHLTKYQPRNGTYMITTGIKMFQYDNGNSYVTGLLLTINNGNLTKVALITENQDTHLVNPLTITIGGNLF